jgi:hypothetical protein
MSGHQQALLSLIANVTQQMQICSRLFSNIGPASGHQIWSGARASARLNARTMNGHDNLQNQAEVQRLQTEAEIKRLQERERTAQAYAKHPALLRMLELETLRELGENANARIYIGFDKHFVNEATKDGN